MLKPSSLKRYVVSFQVKLEGSQESPSSTGQPPIRLIISFMCVSPTSSILAANNYYTISTTGTYKSSNKHKSAIHIIEVVFKEVNRLYYERKLFQSLVNTCVWEMKHRQEYEST